MYVFALFIAIVFSFPKMLIPNTNHLMETRNDDLPVDQAIGVILLNNLNAYMTQYEEINDVRELMSIHEFNRQRALLWNIIEFKMRQVSVYIAQEPTRPWTNECLVLMERVLGRAHTLLNERIRSESSNKN